MDLNDVVRAVLAGDLLTARQWVADAKRSELNWAGLPEPTQANDLELTVAAALAELFAERFGATPPEWTSRVGAQSELMVLDPGLQDMPRSFAHAKAHSPTAFRKRNLVALPNFLNVV
jgi:hypothetical protein